MSLTAKNKKVIKEFFAKVAPKADDIGQEALSRTLFVYPQTKTYFSHWMDLSPSSPQVRKHGSTVMNGVLNAVGLIDDLKGGLLSLSELHAFMLRIDPANFKIFNHNMLVSLAMMFPDDFTPSVHVSVDKFLSQSRDHDGEELLESGLNFRSESSAHLSSHNNVVRVHAQLLGVQHAQIGVGGFDIVHVLHGQLQALHHSFTMSSDHGVPHDSSGIVEVSKLGEVPLGPWVHDETPIEKPLSGIEFMKESEHKPGQSLRTNHLRVKFGEDVLDGGCLEICPHDHVSALDVQLLTQKRKSPLHRSLLQRQLTPTMSLSAKDKAAVKALWAKVAGKADDIGHDALSRMLVVYPQTKTYFSHWKDLTPGSAPVRKHGSTVMGGVAEAVSKIDDLTSGLLNLSELHAYLLRVDPANFKILSHNILVVLATMFPNDFTPEAHVAMDKFLAALALAISLLQRQLTPTMSLSAKDKAAVKALWAKVAGKADDIGHDALSRMLVVYPQTKTYFSHWKDLTPGSAPVRKHGSTVMGGVAEAVSKIDDLTSGLLNLSELHAYLLRVDPANFKILSHNILVVLATMFPNDFTPEAHVAMDKFLASVALAIDHDGEELLESGLNFRSESSAHLSSHNNVVRVHAQLLGVQHAQIGVGGFDIVHVLHGQLQALHHSFTMSSDHGVPHDSSGIVEVSKLGEVPLGPWVHDETPIEKPLSGIEFMKESEHKPGQSLRTNHLRVKFGEDVLDGGCLEICPHDHVSALDVQLLTQKRKSPNRYRLSMKNMAVGKSTYPLRDYKSLLKSQLYTMSLSAKDKAAVVALWAKISGKADDIGHDALSRMLTVYPQTKTYFSHWTDLTPGSAPVRKHGSTVMAGVAEAVSKIDDLTAGLLNLSELHAFVLRVDPANFKILSHNILVVLATMFPNDFTPEAHVAMDKFLAALALAMSEKYR
ncbi:hypothetical protein DNTS_025392 [Danionella cerebrum]|uniref:Globin domain-containing protein n=1 Tax=Danionella cerebrum TaxID=2873325 RepID=A0A553QH05_9TELE|nr:hypothetical protein DNTS_025392 [Danionella translucida]